MENKMFDIETYEKWTKEIHRKHFPKGFRVFDHPTVTSGVAVFYNGKAVGMQNKERLLRKNAESDWIFESMDFIPTNDYQ